MRTANCQLVSRNSAPTIAPARKTERDSFLPRAPMPSPRAEEPAQPPVEVRTAFQSLVMFHERRYRKFMYYDRGGDHGESNCHEPLCQVGREVVLDRIH